MDPDQHYRIGLIRTLNKNVEPDLTAYLLFSTIAQLVMKILYMRDNSELSGKG